MVVVETCGTVNVFQTVVLEVDAIQTNLRDLWWLSVLCVN